MAKISFYSNDMEATISIPAEWEICDGCQGEGCTLVGYVTLADLNERHSDKAKKAEYIRVAKSYDDRAFQVADEDSRRESPYGNQKAVKDHLDNADRFYEMAGTTREEQA